MSEVEQAQVFLRLRKELGEIRNEIAALDAYLKKIGKQLIEAGTLLQESPEISQDWGMLRQVAEELPQKVNRYLSLQNSKTSLDGQLAKFGEPFVDAK